MIGALVHQFKNRLLTYLCVLVGGFAVREWLSEVPSAGATGARVIRTHRDSVSALGEMFHVLEEGVLLEVMVQPLLTARRTLRGVCVGEDACACL